MGFSLNYISCLGVGEPDVLSKGRSHGEELSQASSLVGPIFCISVMISWLEPNQRHPNKPHLDS